MTQSEIDFFDTLAPEWDINEVRSTPERIKFILSRIPFSPGMKVLDLGTGTGVLIPYLSTIVGEKGCVVGVDLSEGMLSQAIRKYGDLKNVRFLKLDFEEEIIPGKFDVVLLYSVYPHLHFPSQTLEWLFRMNLETDGCIVIAFPSDEKFINNIHHERKSQSDHLPPASVLASIIRRWGYETEIALATSDEYVVIVRQLTSSESDIPKKV